MMNLDETVVLRTYAGEALAHIAASALGSEGIEAHIQKDDCGGAYPSLQMSGGVRLLVRPADLERAEKILDEMEAEDSGKVEQEEPEDRKEKKSGLILILRGGFLFLLGLAAGYLLSSELTIRSMHTGVVKEDWKYGKPGRIYHYLDGKLTFVEEDRNYDGESDARHKFVAGKMRTSAYDDGFRGRRNRWAEYKDPFNYVERVDTDFDGKPDATAFYVNELLHRMDWYPKDSAIIERRELYEHGVLKEKLVDTDGDGIFDLRITYDAYASPMNEAKCRIPNHSGPR